MTRILIADDSPPVRCGVAHFAGTECQLAGLRRSCGRCGCHKKARQLAPDLIVMEFFMPQMDGIQAAREIAKSAIDIQIPALHSASFASNHRIGL